ncbi:MAG: hypothetical protein V8Q30_05405 [Acutalibacteraceae bacterium]
MGESTAQRMEAMGIYTIGQLAQFDRRLLLRKLGKNGDGLWLAANGQDHAPVALENAEEEVRSIGNSVTCPRDLQTAEEVWRVLLPVAESVSRRLRRQGTVRRDGGADRQGQPVCLCGAQPEAGVQLPMDSARAAMTAFLEHYKWERPVRAVGLRAVDLMDEAGADQTCLYGGFAQTRRREAVESRVDALRQKYGRDIIRRAVLLEEENAHRFHGSDPAPMPTFHSR